MTSVRTAGVCALLLLALTACGSGEGGAGTTATSTVTLNSSVYVTAAPLLTTSTVPVNSVSGAVAGEQSYTVVANDYLIAIAKKFCIGLDSLVAYNAWPEGLNHKYNPGDVFKIPPRACDPATQATPAPAVEAVPAVPQETSTTAAATGDGNTYTVVANDYLGGIAAKLGTTVEALVAANGWPEGDQHLIIPGQKIVVPAKTG